MLQQKKFLLPKQHSFFVDFFFFFFKWDGSMHSRADALAFSRGDGCCGVYKAPE